MIEDTSFILDLIDGRNEALDILEEVENNNEKVSAVTVLELKEGIKRSDKPEEEKKQVLEVLKSKIIVSADKKVMDKAGKISGELINKGKRIEREDCIIAATAILENEALVTGNRKHFERIEELKLKTYDTEEENG